MLARNPDKLKQFSDLPLDIVHGALEDTEKLDAFASNVDVIIHCAGSVRGLTLSDFAPANVEAVSNLVNAQLRGSNNPRFLLISSLAARMPELSDYANSKRQGEETLKTYTSKVNWTIIRPAAIYGDGDREMKPLLDLLRKGICLQMSHAGSHFSLVHVNDIARAVLQWLNNGTANHEIIELDDGFSGGYSWIQISEIASRVFQRPVRRIQLPTFILQTLARLSASIAMATRLNPMLTPGKARELSWHDWVCQKQPNVYIEHWHPTLQFEQGLKKLYSLGASKK